MKIDVSGRCRPLNRLESTEESEISKIHSRKLLIMIQCIYQRRLVNSFSLGARGDAQNYTNESLITISGVSWFFKDLLNRTWIVSVYPLLISELIRYNICSRESSGSLWKGFSWLVEMSNYCSMLSSWFYWHFPKKAANKLYESSLIYILPHVLCSKLKPSESLPGISLPGKAGTAGDPTVSPRESFP